MSLIFDFNEEEKEVFKNNIEKLKYFSLPIQSSGSFSYYSIKLIY